MVIANIIPYHSSIACTEYTFSPFFMYMQYTHSQVIVIIIIIFKHVLDMDYYFYFFKLTHNLFDLFAQHFMIMYKKVWSHVGI